MKLSDVRGAETLDIIADCIEPIANIAEDETAAKLFKREKPPEGVTVKSFMLKRVKESAPPLIKNHKNDLIRIFAAIAGVTPEEYVKDLNFAKLLSDFIELMTDDAFTVFFQ